MNAGRLPRRLGAVLAALLLSISLLPPIADAAAPAAVAAPATAGQRADRAVALAAGDRYTCALLADGTVRCWGRNWMGELGDGTMLDRHTPVMVIAGEGRTEPLSGVTAISAGVSHTCALLADGTVRCWGANYGGQLGDGTTTTRLAPVTVIAGAGGAEPLERVIGISAGHSRTCALIANGTVKCWGWNAYGQLGDGTTTTRLAPVTVIAASGSSKPLSGVTAISGDSPHTCALIANGTVKCWGWNATGQLGDGTTTDRHVPVTVIAAAGSVEPLARVTAIDAGGFHTCALVANGTARCWGRNAEGQLGNGTATERQAPVTVIASAGRTKPLARVTTIDADYFHTCALLASGAVKCWGANGTGQLGDGTTTERHAPRRVIAAEGSAEPLARVTAISAGLGDTCALREGGTVKCWGWNDHGQLGDGTTTPRRAPVTVIAAAGSHEPLTNVGRRTIAAGDYHSCALLADGTVRCWGTNAAGQLGDGTTTGRREPATVLAAAGSGDPLAGVIAIAAGARHTCALVSGGTVRCWGDDTSGQLGDDGGAGPGSSVPLTVVAAPGRTDPLGGVTAIAAGSWHTCAVMADGTVRCWGANAAGQLGDGTTTERPAPVKVVLDDGDRVLARVTAIAAGDAHSCAKLAAGMVRCWGANGSGQLGDGTTTGRLTPVRVIEAPGSSNNLAGVVAIATGDDGTCAGLVRGAVKCWGANGSGQLGDGTTTGRHTPVKVIAAAGDPAELRGVGGLAAGAAHGCVVLADGSARCFGANDAGALGDGTSGTDRLVPVGVLAPSGSDPLTAVNGLAAGAAHSCAVRSAGPVLCWGRNASGQLGDGTTTDSSIPVIVRLP